MRPTQTHPGGRDACVIELGGEAADAEVPRQLFNVLG